MVAAVTDTVAASGWGQATAGAMSVAPEQLGMKVGMLAAAVFPLLGVLLLLYMRPYFKKNI